VREDQEQSRYADNLAYRAQSVKEGQQVLEYARRLLNSKHLELKGEGDVTDLRQGYTSLFFCAMTDKVINDTLIHSLCRQCRKEAVAEHVPAAGTKTNESRVATFG
jgi:hypothetical protein